MPNDEDLLADGSRGSEALAVHSILDLRITLLG